jgi:hypothetical protein
VKPTLHLGDSDKFDQASFERVVAPEHTETTFLNRRRGVAADHFAPKPPLAFDAVMARFRTMRRRVSSVPCRAAARRIPGSDRRYNPRASSLKTGGIRGFGAPRPTGWLQGSLHPAEYRRVELGKVCGPSGVAQRPAEYRAAGNGRVIRQACSLRSTEKSAFG